MEKAKADHRIDSVGVYSYREEPGPGCIHRLDGPYMVSIDGSENYSFMASPILEVMDASSRRLFDSDSLGTAKISIYLIITFDGEVEFKVDIFNSDTLEWDRSYPIK